MFDKGHLSFAGVPSGWTKYDIHHILPREYGGANDFENLTPVESETEHRQFNRYWADYE